MEYSANEGLDRETQSQQSTSSGQERTRRCTQKMQDHGDSAGIEIFVQNAPDKTFRPYTGALGCATHLEPNFG